MKKNTKDKYKRNKYKSKNKTLSVIIISKILSVLFFILSKTVNFIFSKLKSYRLSKRESRNNERKMFSNRCNIISALVVLLSVFFVYVEESIFYVYPIITAVVPFMYFSEGINLDIFDEYKDLKLYNAILKINAFVLGFAIIGWYQELWFINILSTSTFIIPYIIGNINKEEDWEVSNNKYRKI